MIFLNKEDLQEITELYREAQKTPIIGFSVKQMVEGRDLASLAWDHVRHKMDELGEKYGFDPRKMKGIKFDTGEVVL